MTELATSIIHRSDATVVAVVGDLDLATAPSFGQAVADAIAHTADLPVVVDLAAVRFCDSSGIRALVHGRRLADEHQVAFRVIGATGLVLDVLTLTGVWADLSGESPP
jgi:anti-sigma B factor antagonist